MVWVGVNVVGYIDLQHGFNFEMNSPMTLVLLIKQLIIQAPSRSIYPSLRDARLRHSENLIIGSNSQQPLGQEGTLRLFLIGNWGEVPAVVKWSAKKEGIELIQVEDVLFLGGDLSFIEAVRDYSNQRSREIRIRNANIVNLFALGIFLCDALLHLRTESQGSEPFRFFEIFKKLPMELQMTLCHRTFGSKKDNITSEEAERGFKWLAELITQELYSSSQASDIEAMEPMELSQQYQAEEEHPTEGIDFTVFLQHTQNVLQLLRELPSKEDIIAQHTPGPRRAYSFSTTNLHSTPFLDALQIVFDKLILEGLPLDDILDIEGRECVTAFHVLFKELSDNLQTTVESIFPATVSLHWLGSDSFLESTLSELEVRNFDKYCTLGVNPERALDLCDSYSKPIDVVIQELREMINDGAEANEETLSSLFSSWRAKELLSSTASRFGEKFDLKCVIETLNEQTSFWGFAHGGNFPVKNRKKFEETTSRINDKEITFCAIPVDEKISDYLDEINECLDKIKTATQTADGRVLETWFHAAVEGSSVPWLESEKINMSHANQDFGASPSYWLYDSLENASGHIYDWVMESEHKRILENQRPVIEIYLVPTEEKEKLSNWTLNYSDDENENSDQSVSTQNLAPQEAPKKDWQDLVFHSRNSQKLSSLEHPLVQRADATDWVFGAQFENIDAKTPGECRARFKGESVVMQLALKKYKSLRLFHDGFRGVVLAPPYIPDTISKNQKNGKGKRTDKGYKQERKNGLKNRAEGTEDYE